MYDPYASSKASLMAAVFDLASFTAFSNACTLGVVQQHHHHHRRRHTTTTTTTTTADAAAAAAAAAATPQDAQHAIIRPHKRNQSEQHRYVRVAGAGSTAEVGEQGRQARTHAHLVACSLCLWSGS
jgi:hypothetical protein